MKKRIYFLMMTMAVLLFTGCSSEEEYLNNSPQGGDPQGKIGFSFPMNKEGVTYAGTAADGTIDASANEKIVKSVRIFMFETGGSKLLKDWQTFSETDLATNGGKALFDVTGATGGFTFYAVANADSHIPAASLSSLVKGTATLADFQKIISNNTGATHLKAEADKGLLMTGFRDVTNVVSPSAAEKVINLKRRVARFDVVNQENDKVLNDGTGTNFKIEKIYISDANYAGYITAESSAGATISKGDLNVLTYTGTNDGAENKSVFYLWPTTLDKNQTKTVISIEGMFNGVRQIYKITPASDIDVKGNFRYILKVKRVALTKIDFDIVVDKWNEGGDVTGEQNKTATTWSALTNPTLAGGTFNATMDGTTVNFDASANTGTAVLTLTATSYRSGATSIAESILNGTSSGGTDITVAASEVVTYAGAQFVTTYTITIPKQSNPVDRKITISDIADPNNKKVIVIKAVPNYLATAHKPVLVGGIYWAPVNVGATSIDATTLDLASMGNVYQWGRNYATVTKAGTNVLSGDELAGPASLINATTGTHKDKFILNAATPYNWLLVDGTITTQAQADALWSGANVQAVCPDGWRLPTQTELEIIKGKYSTANFDATKHRLKVTGDNGTDELYLPAAGSRNGVSGGSYSQGSDGAYWSSTVSTTNAVRLYFNASGSSVGAPYRAYGLSVRCVQK